MSSSGGERYELIIRPLLSDLSNSALYTALHGVFLPFGVIIRASVRRSRPDTFALVQFYNRSDALRAMHEVHGSRDFGQPVSVSWSATALKSFTMSYDVRVEQHPWKLDAARVIDRFARYGPTVPIKHIADGFAYVRFAHAEAAQKAIDELHGKLFDGVEVSVRWTSACTLPGLVVRFLPFDVSIRNLRTLFGKHGSLTNVHIARDRESGEKIGTAYLQFLRASDAEHAMDSLDGLVMSRGPIRISWTRASMPPGHVLRVVDVAEGVDRKRLKAIFSRYGGLRSVDVEYDDSTGLSARKATVTFAGRGHVLDVITEFGGRFLRNDDGIISLEPGYDVRVEQHPWKLDEARIFKLFARYGPAVADADVMFSSITNIADGFAYVRFAHAEAAQKAIDEVDGRDVDGVEVSVWWKSATTRPGEELVARYMPYDVSARTIRNLFGALGPLTNVHIMRDRESGDAYAHVKFLHERDAERALEELDGYTMTRGPIRITWGVPSRPSGHVLRVVGLPEDVDRKALKELFSLYGELRSVEVDYDRAGMSTLRAFVNFANPDAVQAVVTAFDGRVLRNNEGIIRMTKGPLVRIFDLDETVDRPMLEEVFSRYGELLRVEVDYSRITGRSTGRAYVIFADPDEAEAALAAFGGRFLHIGEGVVNLPMDRLNFELERIPAVEAATISGESDSASMRAATGSVDDVEQVDAPMDLIDLSSPSPIPHLSAVDYESSPPPLLSAFVSPMEASYVYDDKQEYENAVHFYAATDAIIDASNFESPRAAIPDLLTDSVIHITTSVEQVDASVDLIDLSDPSPPPLPSAFVSPARVGYVYAKKRGCKIPVHFYGVSEIEKLEMATRIMLAGGYAGQDDNNNEPNTKVTLVARSSTELIAAMLRVDAAGVDCFSCDGYSIRDGHSSHPSERMTVNVTKAPACSKIKHSQHVVFLSPIDDPEDMQAAMEVMMLQRTDVNLVSALFDEGEDDQRLQVTHMLNVMALAQSESSWLQFLC